MTTRSVRVILVPLVLGLLASCAHAPAPTPSPTSDKNLCSHDEKNFRCVRYIRNYDGDTVTVEIPGVHPLLGQNISVRVAGIDTPEKNGKKPCEKERAAEAQRLVQNLLTNATLIELRNVGRDKYFRVLAEVWADGKSIGDLLIEKDLAYPYAGGQKPVSISWCRK